MAEQNKSRSMKIGITMGCPVGIGPEIILRFLALRGKTGETPVVLGDIGVLRRCASALAIDIALVPWQAGMDAADDVVPVLETSRLDADSLAWGRPTVETGKAMAGSIIEAVRLLKRGELDCLVTCPITKSALYMAGYRFPGHTEMLADLTDSRQFAMMMAGSRLRVVLATIHLPLAEVPARINSKDLVKLIILTGNSLRQDFGIKAPRIGVAGLNPHAGEGGLFGSEESAVIAPAVDEALARGWDVTGPLPPDTVFHRAAAGSFDVVVCMYHDQGLIPFKLLHFTDGVNVTIGLPIVRTSVDHGTAYDIAGKGVASPESLRSAYGMARDIVMNRNRCRQQAGDEC